MAVARGVVARSALVALVMVAGCRGAGQFALRSSPHERYGSMLRDAGLDTTTLGAQWTASGEAALRNPAPVVSPFSESGYVAADRPDAVAYRLCTACGCPTTRSDTSGAPP